MIRKKDADKNKDDNKKTDGESPAIVLKLDLHCDCQGCTRKVKGSIRRIQGVESVNVDMAGNIITVTGEVDPTRVKERTEKKMKKKVEIVSPQVSATKEVQSSTVVLKILLHCQGCMYRIRRTVSKFKGVESAIPDASKDLILVKGTMNVKELVPHLKQKFKRQVDVVLPNNDEKSDEKVDVKEVKFEGVGRKEKGNNSGDGEKKKHKVKADAIKSVKFKGVDKKEKVNNGGDDEKKKDGEKYMKKDEANADASKSVSLTGFPFPTRFYGEKNKDGDNDMKKDELKADASKSIKLKGVDKKEKENNGGDGEKKKDGDKDMKKDGVKAEGSISVKFKGVNKKEKGNNGGDGEKKKDGDKEMEKDEVKADASKSVQLKGVDKKQEGKNGGDGEKKKDGDKDMKKDEVKADSSKSVKFKRVDKKEEGNNGGDGEKKKDGDKDMKKEEVTADASKRVSLIGFPFPTGFYGEKNKDGDKDIKQDEVKADASKHVDVVNKLEYCGQNPFTYTMPMYNQSYYIQDYGISTSNHGYENMGYANHWYMHDSRGLDAGMFSDENPNATCSIM